MLRLWLVSIVMAALAGCSREQRGDVADEDLSAASGLRFLQGDEAQGFARATEPRPFAFPRDHGVHPEYRTEWWYLTGNLEGPEGREFGFQLTFFRFALRAGETPAQSSAWRARQAWMAHFAVTDARNDRFLARERMAREALGLAGASGEPVRIFVEDWALTLDDRSGEVALTTSASDGEVALSLTGSTRSAPIAQGEDGLDRKGPEAGNASYYYSIPDIDLKGTLRIDGAAMPVRGIGWLDREWGTSALSDGIVGWDWFALQFDGGGSLMYYRLRDSLGAASPYSGGSLVDAAGVHRRLAFDGVSAEPREFWTSELTGRRYPVAWRVQVPSAELDLEVSALIPQQELNLSVRYWEGAARVVGRAGPRTVAGRGYIELTGY